jgi:hypothetical protein
MLATTMARVKYFFQALSPQPDIRHIAQLSPVAAKREPGWSRRKTNPARL